MSVKPIPEETLPGSKSASKGGNRVLGWLLCDVTGGVEAGNRGDSQGRDDDPQAEFQRDLRDVDPDAVKCVQNHLDADKGQDE